MRIYRPFGKPRAGSLTATVILLVALFLGACQTFPTTTVPEEALSKVSVTLSSGAHSSDLGGYAWMQELYRNGDLANNRAHPTGGSGPGCANPMPDKVRECDEIEQRILASTVRLEWHLWIKNGNGYAYVDGSTGHATIKEGRYLVTHNHLGISLSDPKNGELTTVSVFAANGKPIWLEAPLKATAITVKDAETLVLDFGSYSGEGLFGSRGMSSAEFKAWKSLPLQPGMEVAQIDWDGAATHVDWVTVDAVITEGGTPRLELANSVMPGASGGGVFRNGYHVANTWSQGTEFDENSGVVLRQYSTAALNPPHLSPRLPERSYWIGLLTKCEFILHLVLCSW